MSSAMAAAGFYSEPLAVNSGARVGETFGNGTFSYQDAQSAENPELSVWRFSVFGGLSVSGDPEGPGEISSRIGAMRGAHAMLARGL